MSDPLSPNSSGDELAPPRRTEAAEPRSWSIPCCSGRLWGVVLVVVVAMIYFKSTRGSSVSTDARIPSAVPSGVTWAEDLPVALVKAKETRQPVLLRFSAVWCVPCKVMQREVFSRGDVAGALAKWITVSIDADKHPSSVSKYKIEMYPTFILLNSDGGEVFRYEGTLSAEEFIQLIQNQKVSFPGRRGKRLDVFPDSQPWLLPQTCAPTSTLLQRLPLSQDRPADLKRNPTGRLIGNKLLSSQYLAGPSETATRNG